jgi:hypothetical protein
MMLMTSIPVTSLFVAASAGWLIALSVLAMQARVKHKVALGTGQNAELERKMRAQANAAEYLPIMALLLLVLEAQGLYTWLCGVFAVAMLLGRVSHAYGLLIAEPKRKDLNWRIRGMMLTWGPLGLAAVALCLQTFGVL